MKAFIFVALFAMVATAAFAAPHHEAGHTTDDHSAHASPETDHAHEEHHEHADTTKEEPSAPVAEKEDEALTGSAASYIASPYAYSAYPAFRAYPYAGYGAYPYAYHGYGGFPLYYR